MSAEEQLFEKYRHRGRMLHQATLLLQHADAVAYVDDCEQLGARILGMDWYTIDQDGKTEWVNSTDASTWDKISTVAERVAAARRLLAHGIPEGGEWVEFTIDG